MLNNKHVLDFTGNTDEPLDLGKESFRIFIKAVDIKCSSYQNTISEKYWKTGQEQRQNLTQYLCIVNNKYTCIVYTFNSINTFVYVNYANYIHLQKFYFTVYLIYIIYDLKKNKQQKKNSPSLILLLKCHHTCLLRSLVINQSSTLLSVKDQTTFLTPCSKCGNFHMWSSNTRAIQNVQVLLYLLLVTSLTNNSIFTFSWFLVKLPELLLDFFLIIFFPTGCLI